MWRKGESEGGEIVVRRLRWVACFQVADRLKVAIGASCVFNLRIHEEFDLGGMV